MMYLNLSDEELRSICRTNIEALEKWARLLLNKVLVKKYGVDYIHTKNADGNYMFRKKLVEKADEMMTNEPGRFPTSLDTLFLEDLVYVICHDKVYPLLSKHFKETDFYPQGKEQIRTHLDRLIPIRNKLSHTNPFSNRDAQRAVCYSNDFIDAVKYYFEQENMEKEFNVPTIIKITDSFGNETIPSETKETIHYQLIDPATKQQKVLRRGDKFSVTLEIDPSFSQDDYHLEWQKYEGMDIVENGKKIIVEIGNELIGENNLIGCKVISSNEWHRYNGYDQRFILQFKALPEP